ncbi:hypothetical protein HANVADRAFT_54592 [Hanseniaspora valbyensis NRRL Y-1626]|uniref:Vps72/YL1 C-terminal domain-containing protein n=1 Tax=Hanseniaspora valbyensis NRRL Y-1626 TaxID=766949 RepID=A0A1B7TK98_9ASCO|nr:hypothetical protein HANVADRAFT_54592 [Hanseniaspora valbyensis NRRL Y-1626]
MNPADFYDLKVKAHKPALKHQFDYTDVNNGLDSTYPTIENRFKPWNELMHESAYVKAAVKQIQDSAVCPITGGKVEYFDPVSGLPTHSSEEAYLKDTNYIESNRPELLKLAVAYENDSISKRDFPEYDLAEEQAQGQSISYNNWESWFYTRQFNSMETQFHIAQSTKFLTYPITIASILAQNSPYFLTNKNGSITHEGLKSLSALRYSIFPKFRETTSVNEDDLLQPDRALRIFIVGSKSEALLPIASWMYETMKGLLDTKCPVFMSGHSIDGFMNDWKMIMDRYDEQLDIMMEPTENVFGSTKWQINPYMPTYAFQSNMFIGGFRGKRYHAVKVDE